MTEKIQLSYHGLNLHAAVWQFVEEGNWALDEGFFFV